MSLAIKEIDCLPTLILFVCLSYKDFSQLYISCCSDGYCQHIEKCCQIPQADSLYDMMHKFLDLQMIKFKCKLYSCRNADLTLILVVAMTNGFILKIIFHYSNLRGGVCLTWLDLKKIKFLKLSVIHSFYQTKSDSISQISEKITQCWT